MPVFDCKLLDRTTLYTAILLLFLFLQIDTARSLRRQGIREGLNGMV
jgi:hypothetical protein